MKKSFIFICLCITVITTVQAQNKATNEKTLFVSDAGPLGITQSLASKQHGERLVIQKKFTDPFKETEYTDFKLSHYFRDKMIVSLRQLPVSMTLLLTCMVVFLQP